MNNWKEFDAYILDLKNKHFNNTELAKELFPNGSFKDIENLRKYISRKRKYNDFKPLKTKSNINTYKTKIEPFKGDLNNILIIGDLHAPFTLPKYLKFCRQQQELYNCGTVIFIGDIIDNHYSSYHESDPDGYSAGEELDRAIDMISDWYYTFPKATVIIGNHDRLVYRKAYSSGVSKRWIREYKDVLNTADWNFVENIELFSVNFNHGEGGTAMNRIKTELQSQVQGHLHTELYVKYLVGANFIVYGMQVGCGVDIKSYAMAYGKNFKKSAIGCGVVLNSGTLPIAIPMKM